MKCPLTAEARGRRRRGERRGVAEIKKRRRKRKREIVSIFILLLFSSFFLLSLRGLSVLRASAFPAPPPSPRLCGELGATFSAMSLCKLSALTEKRRSGSTMTQLSGANSTLLCYRRLFNTRRGGSASRRA